ncbi:MAG TPA: hypothetical protein VLF40_02670 [Candidatus Saccharimonadales bacterium]|nr:hypothetical protein [Candidatus Saccharimonadales bacterium]
MAFVQAPTPTGLQSGPTTSLALAYGSNNTAGNCLLACVQWNGFSAAAILTGLTDTRGNTWVQISSMLGGPDGATQTGNTYCALFAVFGCAAGSNTVTANWTTSGADLKGLIIAEYSNVASIDVLTGQGATSPSGGAANNATSGSMTTNFNGQTILGFFMSQIGATDITIGTSPNLFTQRAHSSANGAQLLEEFTQTSAGSIAATASIADPGVYFGIVVALRTSVSTVTLDAVAGSGTMCDRTITTYGETPVWANSQALLPVTIAWSHVCSGSNRAVIVAAAFGNETGSDASVTLTAKFGDVAMTSLGSVHSGGAGSHANGFVQMFGLTNPPAGTSGVTVTASGSGATGRLQLLGGSISFFNVNQTSSFGTAVTNSNSSVNSSITASVSTASSNNMVVDAAVQGTGISSSSQQMRLLNNFGILDTSSNLAGSTAYATGGSVSMGYTCSGNDYWGIVAVEVKN